MDNPRRIRPVPLLLFLTFLAFTFYTFRLDYQSLWYDEGFSVYLARMSLGEITARTARDIHPPLYYYLLHFWVLIFGTREFALRFLSLIFGVLTVPLIYGVGRRLLGQGSGLLAAALVAISPLFLWYSQEARMYTLVVALGLLSTYLLLLIMGGVRRRALIWSAYVVCGVIAVYTHFYAFFVLIFQLLFLLSWWALWSRGQIRKRWPALAGGLLCQLTVLLAYLPWSGFVMQRYGADVSYWKGTLRVSEVVRKTLIMFSTGHSVLEAIAQPIAWGYVCILLASLAAVVLRIARGWTPAEKDDAPAQPLVHRWPWLTLSALLLYLGLPCLLLLLISYQRAKFHPRYLMLSSPAFFLLLAAGLASFLALARTRVWRRRIVALAMAYSVLCYIGVTSGYAIYNAYFDINFLKDDFRSAARFIAEHKGKNEVVILTSGHFFPVFTYYYDDDDWYPIPDEPTLSAEHVLDYSVAHELNRILRGREGVWVLLWQHEVVDPVGFLTMMLGEEGTVVPYEGGFWGLRLLHYALPPDAHFSSEPHIEHPTIVNFGDQVQLLGYTMEPPRARTDEVKVVLYWQALQDVSEDYKVSLRLRDEHGHDWGGFDGRPTSLLYPTFRWPPGKKLFGEAVITPTVGTPPGEYQLQASVYSDINLVGLDVLDPQGTPTGTTASLGSVQLQKGRLASLADVQPSHHMEAALTPGLKLVGYDLSRSAAQPGDTLQLSLYWHTSFSLEDDYVFLLQLYDERGRLIDQEIDGPEVAGWEAASDSALGGRAYHAANRWYPTSLWRAGEVVVGQYDYIVPLHAAAGPGELRVTLVHCLGGLASESLSALEPGTRNGDMMIAFRSDSSGEDRVLACYGQALPSRVVIAPFQVEATQRVFTAPEAEHRVAVGNLGNKVSLYGYDLSAEVAHPGDTLFLTLYWQALDCMDTSYTVFTHLLDRANRIRAQMDSAPQGGARPTTGWVPGEYIRDEYQLVVEQEAVPGDYIIEVGMYDPATPDFRRLLLLDSEGSVIDNRIVLDTAVRVPVD